MREGFVKIQTGWQRLACQLSPGPGAMSGMDTAASSGESIDSGRKLLTVRGLVDVNLDSGDHHEIVAMSG
jgi:hypothetical protein